MEKVIKYVSGIYIFSEFLFMWLITNRICIQFPLHPQRKIPRLGLIWNDIKPALWTQFCRFLILLNIMIHAPMGRFQFELKL